MLLAASCIIVLTGNATFGVFISTKGRCEAMAEIKFEIVKTFGVLSEGSKGWKKEFNLVRWNEKEPKYDIRDWSPDHKMMGKGVTLTEEEVKRLKEIIAEIE